MARRSVSKANQALEIPGIDKFIRDCKHAEADVDLKMKKANNDAAAVVLKQAVRYRDSQPGAARKTSIKTGNSASRSSLVVGSAKEPWALGAEFGAKRFRQFQPWQGNQWRDAVGDSWGGAAPQVGYFLHHAIRDTRDEFKEEYGRQIDLILDDLAREH